MALHPSSFHVIAQCMAPILLPLYLDTIFETYTLRNMDANAFSRASDTSFYGAKRLEGDSRSRIDVYRGQLTLPPDKPSLDVGCKIGFGKFAKGPVAHEAVQYNCKLRHLQGEYVPYCHGYFVGDTDEGLTACILLTYCGEPIYEMPIYLPIKFKAGLVRALVLIHDAGLNHLDLTAGNILDHNGRPTIIDFEGSEDHECGRQIEIEIGTPGPSTILEIGCGELYQFFLDFKIWTPAIARYQLPRHEAPQRRVAHPDRRLPRPAGLSPYEPPSTGRRLQIRLRDRAAHEASLYDKLCHLQDVCIPLCHGYFAGDTDEGPTGCILLAYRGEPIQNMLTPLPPVFKTGLVNALVGMHDARVKHLDLRQRTILAYNGRPIIIDFGSAPLHECGRRGRAHPALESCGDRLHGALQFFHEAQDLDARRHPFSGSLIGKCSVHQVHGQVVPRQIRFRPRTLAKMAPSRSSPEKTLQEANQVIVEHVKKYYPAEHNNRTGQRKIWEATSASTSASDDSESDNRLRDTSGERRSIFYAFYVLSSSVDDPQCALTLCVQSVRLRM